MGDGDLLYVTWVAPERGLLKVYGQTNRACGSYIENQLSQLDEEFKHSSAPNPSRIRRGLFCFAKYVDGTLYRARIISEVQGSYVKVVFIDYGNVEYVEIANIRLAESANSNNAVLTKMADQAREYYLARVMAPLGGWIKENIDDIKAELCNDEVYCSVVAKVHDHEIIAINFRNEDYASRLIKLRIAQEIPIDYQEQMILSSINTIPQEVSNQRRQGVQNSYPNPPPGLHSQSFNFAQQQLNERYGKSAMSEPRQPESQMNPRLSIPQNVQSNSFKPQVKETHLPPSAAYAPPFTPTQIKEPVVQQNLQQQQQQSIQQSLQNMQNVQNLQNLQQFTPTVNPLLAAAIPQLNPLAPLMSNAVIEALATQIKQQIASEEKAKPKQETSVLQHYEQNVLEVGVAQSVFISCIDDGPWSFSIQWNENDQQLSTLMEQIAKAKLMSIKKPIALGRPCLAKSPATNQLYRGVVVNVSHAAVTVFYVDFGNSEDVPVAYVFELPPEYLKTKVMSQKFALSGLHKVAHSVEINECFEEIVKDHVLLLKVTSLEGDNLPTCELFVEGKNIKKILNENLRHIKPEEFPGTGDVEKVVATWVESPQKFYVQLRKNDKEINALKSELAQFASKGRIIPSNKLKPGLNCVCLYSGDEQWYRAVIKSVDSEQNKVTVFYIDYGNPDTVEPSALRRIEKGNLISRMNSQAIQCTLNGYENVPFDQDVANALEAAVLEKTLDLEVVKSFEDHIVVNLYDNGVNVNQSFLDVAEPATPEVPVYSPPKTQALPPLMSVKTHHNVEEASSNDEWNSKSPDSPQGYGDRRNDRFGDRGDRGGRFNDRGDRKFEGKPRRFNDSEEDSFGNKNSYDKPKDNWREDKKQEDSWRGSKREDRGGDEGRRFNRDDNKSSDDWGNKDRRDFGDRGRRFDDREKKTDDDWGKPKERGDYGHRSRFDDRDKKSDDGWGKPKNDYGDRKRFDGNKRDDDWGGKKESNDDWGSKKESNDDWGAKKESSNDWGSKKDSNDDWGSKPKGDFGERRKFEDRDNKFADRPKKYPVRRDDAAPPGSNWDEEPIEIGTVQNGIVTYYVSPHDFYVQTDAKKEEFKEMMNEIQTYYVNKFWFKEPPNENDICIARFRDDKVLYRARVISTSPLTVQFVDYGNTDTVGNRDVFVVDKKFLNLPKQAVRCKLVGVKPAEENWPMTGLDSYFEYDEYSCSFFKYSEEENVYDVELKSGEKDISQEIIGAGLALPDFDVAEAQMESGLPEKLPEFDLNLLVNQVYSFYVVYIFNLDKFYIHINPRFAEIVQSYVDNFVAVEENLVPIDRENFEVGKLCISSNGEAYFRARILEITDTGANIHFIDYGDCLEVTDDLILGITDQIAAFPPQATECHLSKTKDIEFPQETHDTFKANYEDKNVLCLCNSVDKDDPTILNVMLYEPDGQKLSIVDKDIDDSVQRIDPIGNVSIATQFLNVIFSYFESPKEINIHRMEDDALLIEFSNNLNAFYNEGTAEDFDCSNPENINQIAVAKSTADEMWYRCRLIGNEEGNANVHYLDYGNLELVPFENVKKIDPSFCEQFIFAKKVEFAVEYDEEVLEGINEKLGEMTMEKSVVGCFVNKEGVAYAEFLTEDGSRFSEILEKEGLCKKKDVFDDFDFDKFLKIGSLEIGTELKGFLSTMDENVKTWFCVHIGEDCENLEVFQGQLQEACVNLPAETNVPNDDIFAAKFMDDDLWYRARIHTQNEENLLVYFIDYGNTAEVNVSDGSVKLLTDDLKNVAPFVKYCQLEGKWTVEGQEKFSELLADVHDEITIVIKDIQERLIVDLIVNGESVVEKLRNEGFEQAEESDLVYITHTNSLKDFYIQMDKDSDVLNKITEELKSSESFENPDVVEIDGIYSAQFPDDSEWYRARIMKNENEIEVFFIDYGNTSVVTNVKILPEELKIIPAIAHNAELIYPDDVEEWQDEDLNKFLEFVEAGELKYKEEKKRGNKLFVSLFHNNERIQDLIKSNISPRPSGIITHVNSLTDFYIRFSSKDEEMNLITEKIAEADSFEELETIEVGVKCAAKFLDDDLWYRAEIVKNLGESYEVKFIDYGNISEVYELKKLNEELSQYEPLAINVCLKNATDDVPDSIKEEFIELATGELQVEFKFLLDESASPPICSVRWFGINLEEFLFIGKSEEIEIVPRTDDDKTRLGIVETVNNLDDDHRAQGLTLNETDEEKSVKAAMGTDNEGFKSDDEKGSSEMAVQSVNVTDNDLIGELDDSVQIIEPDTPQSPDTPETVETDTTEYPEIVLGTSSVKNEESVVTVDESQEVPVENEEVGEDTPVDEGIAEEDAPIGEGIAEEDTAVDEGIVEEESVAEEESAVVVDNANDSNNTIQIDKTESDWERSEAGSEERSNTESNYEIEKGEIVNPVKDCENSPFGNIEYSSSDDPTEGNETGDNFVDAQTSSPEEKIIKAENGHVNGTHDESLSPVVIKKGPIETEDKTEKTNSLDDLAQTKFKSLPRKSLSKDNKIVPGSICRGVSNDELEKNSSTPILKIPHSEKIISGCVRGVVHELVLPKEEKQISVSAPVTPSATRKSAYTKISHQDRIVPACISSTSPIEERKIDDKPDKVPKYEKKPPSEHIVPGVVSGDFSTVEK